MTMEAFILGKPDVEGIFLRRINRFLGIGLINGEKVEVHIHDPGRLGELLRSGIRFFARRKERGRARYSLVAVDLGDELVLLDSSIHNRIAAWLVNNGYMLKDYELVRMEPRFGEVRFDLLLRNPHGGLALVEVKGVTMRVGDTAMFPDAPTKRGTRHMLMLVKAVESGYEAHVLFLVLRRGSRVMRPNEDTDPLFSQSLRYAVKHGVKVWAYGLILGRDWTLRPVGQIEVLL